LTGEKEMSSSEEDERTETLKRDPNVAASGSASEVVFRQSSDGTTQQVVAQPAPRVERESVSKHRTTNTSALVGMVVGIAVLAFGLLLVVKETPYLPYPYSIISIIIVGIALIAVGASLISNRTAMK
jgi:hypothetical protein